MDICQKNSDPFQGHSRSLKSNRIKKTAACITGWHRANYASIGSAHYRGQAAPLAVCVHRAPHHTAYHSIVRRSAERKKNLRFVTERWRPTVSKSRPLANTWPDDAAALLLQQHDGNRWTSGPPRLGGVICSLLNKATRNGRRRAAHVMLTYRGHRPR